MKRQRKNTNILWNQHSPLLLSMVALAVMLLFISSKPQDFAGKAGDAHGSDIGSITLRLGQPQNVVGQNGQQTVTLELMNISEVDTVIRVSVGGRVETLTIPSRNFGGWYQFDDFMLNAESADPEGGSINVKAYLFDSETPLCLLFTKGSRFLPVVEPMKKTLYTPQSLTGATRTAQQISWSITAMETNWSQPE